jgi:hypothetical protein
LIALVDGIAAAYDTLPPSALPAVVRERGAELHRQHARPQQLRLVHGAVLVEERRAAVRRHEAPEQRQVDRGIRAADVAPIDHAARRAAVHEEMAEVQVAVHEHRRLGRRELRGLRK